MSVISVQMKEDNREERYKVYLWEGLGNGDTGEPVNMGGYADRSVQILGTFGSGGTVVIQGSLMAGATPTYATLDDASGTDLSFTSAGIEEVMPMTAFIRPSVTAGDGTTDLDVYLMVRK